MKPQSCPTRTTDQPPAAWCQQPNWLGVPVTSVELAPRCAVTLEVRGRPSGKTRRIPIQRTRSEGSCHLVALEPGATPADIAAVVDHDPVFRIHHGNHDPGHRSDA